MMMSGKLATKARIAAHRNDVEKAKVDLLAVSIR